jgi:hypothetical protein
MVNAPCTAVLSVGYDLPHLLDGGAPVSVFPEALAREDLGGATEAIDAGLHHSGYALAVYPTWLGETTPRRLETIRAALGTAHLALHGSALPPLAGAVLANLASALAVHLTQPGQLVAALGDLERALVVVSWLGRLTGLKEPAPSVLLHLASLSPRSTFAVVLQPEHAIVRADRTGESLPLERAQRPMELVVAPQEGADPAWLAASASAAIGTRRTDTIAPTSHGASWWGTARLVEAVAYPTDLGELAQELASRHRLRLCRWCSEAIASTPCPFCRGVEEPFATEIRLEREASRPP